MDKVFILARNKRYTGTWPTEHGDVFFKKGVAKCSKRKARILNDRPEFSIVEKPNKSSTKDEMQKWCDLKDIDYKADDTKADLMEKINPKDEKEE